MKQLNRVLSLSAITLALTACNSGSAGGTTGNEIKATSMMEKSSRIPMIQNGNIVKDPVLNSTIPLMIMSGPEGKSICTSTLIDPKTVLTAAHCVLTNGPKPAGATYKSSDVLAPGNIEVYLSKDPTQALNLNSGLAGLSKIAISYKVKHVYVHKYAFRSAKVSKDGFELTNLSDLNDIAIIELESSIGSKYPFPQLATANPSIGSNEIIAGYGVNQGPGVVFTDPNKGDPGTLRSATATLINIDGNGTLLDVGGTVNKNGQVGSTKVCQGDSGGPDFTQQNGIYTITGVHSFGDGSTCGKPNTPSTSISVASYNNWIKDGYKTLSISSEHDPIDSDQPTDSLINVTLQPCTVNGVNCKTTLPLVVAKGDSAYIKLTITPNSSVGILKDFTFLSFTRLASDGWQFAKNNSGQPYIDLNCFGRTLTNTNSCGVIMRYVPQGPKGEDLKINYKYRDANNQVKTATYKFKY